MIKDKTGVPVGIGQAAEIDTAMAMRAVLYAHGGSEQDEQGNIVLNSKHTLEAVKVVKAPYPGTMSPEGPPWDAPSNNPPIPPGKAPGGPNPFRITRRAETKSSP